MKIYDSTLVSPDDKSAQQPVHGDTGSAKLHKDSTSVVSVRFWNELGWLDDYDWGKQEEVGKKEGKKDKHAKVA